MPIQITARRDGFRRCGMAHSEKTQTYPDGHFTAEQLKELEGEPQLIVVRIDDGKPAVDATDDALKGAQAKYQVLQKEHQALQGELSRSASIIDLLSGQLAIELESGESLQQELAALKIPPTSDNQADKKTDESAGGDKTSTTPAKAKK